MNAIRRVEPVAWARLALFVGVFLVFSLLYLREAPSWRVGAAFLLILLAVVLAVSSESG